MYHKELDGQAIAKKIAGELTDAANRMDFDPKAFADAVRREHRSIQQSVFIAVVALLDGWARDADTNNFDLRNEDTVKASLRLMNAVGGTDGLGVRRI